jgi:hypothetical protein
MCKDLKGKTEGLVQGISYRLHGMRKLSNNSPLCSVTPQMHTSRGVDETDGGDYEEWRLLGYKNPVPTSQETHYVSATELSLLMPCKI